MPIYEYACFDCNKKFDEFRKISDSSVVACTHCESLNVKKAVSAAAFQLKGGGWYKDGYASTGSPSSKSPSTAKKSEHVPSSPDAKTKTTLSNKSNS